MAYNPYGQIYRYIKACGDNAPKLQQILDDNHALFLRAWGSRHNHQAWEGGYLQHVADCLRFASHIYSIEGDKPFTWSSVVLVLFLHDIEKPFMQAQMAEDSKREPWNQTQRLFFRYELLNKYEIKLTAEEQIALNYIHGEGDDYLPHERTMNELGALCHAADVLSSRLWHSRNKPV